MNSKLLTITIPSYRQEKMLNRALDSLADQTFKNFDVVILDDNSGVDFSNILENFGDSLNIRIIKNENNLGAMKNLQASIFFKCDSDYVLSLHEDDYLADNYLENAIKALESNQDISFTSTRPEWILKTDPYQKFSQMDSKHEMFNVQEFVEAIIKNEPIMFSSIIYRVSDIVDAWDYAKYNTFCDRVFLTEILKQNSSKCVQFTSPGIRVRDHSKDQKDTRSKDVKFSHFFNMMRYYKNILGYRKIKTVSFFKYFIIGIWYMIRK